MEDPGKSKTEDEGRGSRGEGGGRRSAEGCENDDMTEGRDVSVKGGGWAIR